MAKLYFKYGAMGSSKTAQALITRFNYMEQRAAEEGHTLHELTLDEMEALWQQAKTEE